MRGFSKFATTFHFRAQVLPKFHHDTLSELIIQTLELWQRALDLIDVELLVEDERGKPRRVKTWTRALRTIIDEPGAPVPACESLSAIENSQGSSDVSINARFHIEVSHYADRDEAVREIITHALQMGEAALALIGARIWFVHLDREFSASEFAALVQSGALWNDDA